MSSNSASYMAQHSIPEAPGMEGVEPPVIGTGERVRAMMAKVGVLLEGELQAGGEDFMLIESMNTAAGRQYREMAKYASGLVAVMDSLREKRAQLQPSLDAIDRVDESVRRLELVAAMLDDYTRQLEEELVAAQQEKLAGTHSV